MKNFFKNLNALRVRAARNEIGAAQALESMMFVPQHLRRNGFAKQPHGPRIPGTHVTAKTHRAVPCVCTPTCKIENRVERLQMLKTRAERRASRQQEITT